MSNRLFLTIHGSIYTTFAIVLFFIPALLWPIYGVQIDDKYAYFLSQHNSIFLGGIAILSFIFRDMEANSSTAKKLFRGLLWTNILGFVITLYACLDGIFVGFGWSDPAFFALLTTLCFRQLANNSQED